MGSQVFFVWLEDPSGWPVPQLWFGDRPEPQPHRVVFKRELVGRELELTLDELRSLYPRPAKGAMK
jgi:hypothetical protein